MLEESVGLLLTRCLIFTLYHAVNTDYSLIHELVDSQLVAFCLAKACDKRRGERERGRSSRDVRDKEHLIEDLMLPTRTAAPLLAPSA